MFFKPGLNVVQKDHIHHMSSLQAEIAYLKREIEKGRETRPPPTPPTSPLFPQAALALTNPALSLVSSDMCKDLTAKTLKLYLKNHLEFIRSHRKSLLSLQDESYMQRSPVGYHVIDPMETFGPAPYDPV